jgi:hypothetical protein
MLSNNENIGKQELSSFRGKLSPNVFNFVLDPILQSCIATQQVAKCVFKAKNILCKNVTPYVQRS